MKIAIIGAGGVGGYFGARLAAAGCEVTFIARGAHLAAMRQKGLQVRSALGDIHLRPVNATDDPAQLGAVDFAMIGVKLWDTEEAARAAKPLMGPDSAAISFQNGVEAVEILSRVLGKAHVMGGVAHIAALIERPGLIRHNGTMQRLTFGELDGGRSLRAEALLVACRSAGIDAELASDIERVIWTKFVFLVGLSGTTSVARLPIGSIREEPETRAMLLEVMRETAQVGRAKGVNLDPAAAEQQLEFADSLPHDMVSSMLVDLERGNRLELPWLSGTVVRLGRECAIDTPANRFVYAALKLHAHGRPKA
jgi:2-dehydropantoate 2-reductase